MGDTHDAQPPNPSSVAQLIEQPVDNRQVAGLSPATATITYKGTIMAFQVRVKQGPIQSIDVDDSEEGNSLEVKRMGNRVAFIVTDNDTDIEYKVLITDDEISQLADALDRIGRRK